MTMIYFRDGGVFDPGTGGAVTSVYAIDSEEALPTEKTTIPASAGFGPQAVSFDGLTYVQTLDLGENSSASFIDYQSSALHSVPYNLSGGQTKGAGFTRDGRLVVGSGNRIAVISPPYTDAVERDLPISIDGFIVYPAGDKVLLLQGADTAYIADLTTLAIGAPINLLEDEANLTYPQLASISPDGTKFLTVGKYGVTYAAAVFDAVSGDYIGRAGAMPRETKAFFLADSNRIAYTDEAEEAIAIFDLADSSETLVSTSALDDDPQFATGYDYVLQGLTADNYAVLDYFGNLRRVSLTDGSVSATPRTSIETNGFTVVQPISGQPGGQVLKYFWTGFLRSFENPVIVSG